MFPSCVLFFLAITLVHSADLPNLFYFENYDECLKENGVFCRVDIKIKNTPNETSEEWQKIEKFNADRRNYRHDWLRHGLCVSKLCQSSNSSFPNCLQTVYKEKYRKFGISSKVTSVKCETKNSKYNLGTEELILGFLLLCYVIFVVVISALLKFTSKFEKVRVLKVFSIFQNFKEIINKKSVLNEGFLHFLQGFRVITFFGVVMTHATEVNLVTPVANPSYVEEAPTRMVTSILANGGMTVQVYFIISSFLLSKSFFNKLKQSEGVRFTYVLKYIAKRYVRFTPVYALIIVLHGTWLIHLYRGPFWEPIMGHDYTVCRKNWWINILYFNNFVIERGLCMFHSWYLSVDFQFVILGLLFLWMVQKKPKFLFLITVLVVLFQTVFLFWYLIWNKFEIAQALHPELLYFFKLIYSKEWQATWTTTFSSLSPLVFGLCAGYLYSEKSEKSEKNLCFKITWWFVSLLLSLGPLLFTSYYMITDYYGNSPNFAALYGSVNKTIFAFGMTMFIYGFAQDYAGPIRKVFEWGPLYALGNLSFGAYLVHYTLLKIFVAARKALPYVSDISMIYEVTTNVTLSYIISMFLSIFFVVPFAKLASTIV